jgi:hypothetical protein
MQNKQTAAMLASARFLAAEAIARIETMQKAGGK